MSEYLNQFNPFPEGNKPSENLEHYRIEIRKLQQKLAFKTSEYEKRISQLQSEIKHQRKPIFQNTSNNKPNSDNINYEVYQKDNLIKELKAQNTKLRQVINNPDQILIKKNNNFEIITEKDNQINRLKKALIDIQSKYDGQYFTEHKTKKQYEMLAKENEALKMHIFKLEKENSKASKGEGVSMDILENINYKKQLDVITKENEVLKKVIMQQEQEKINTSRVSQLQMQKGDVRKSTTFAMGTQLEDAKLEVEQFKAKNKQLQKRVNQLTQQNQKYQAERERNRKSNNLDSRNLSSKVQREAQVEEQVKRYYQNRQTIRSSLLQEPIKDENTSKKIGKYYELGVDQRYSNRGNH